VPAEAAGDLALTLSFYAIAAVTVVSALMVVSLRNIFHAGLFLVLAFVGVAGVYLTLNAAFMAAVQVLVYGGAIAVLMLFAIFLTRNAMTQGNPPGRFRAPALLAALLVGVTFSYVFLMTRWPVGPTPPYVQPEAVAGALFTDFVFPFELASVLLLAAMIGAIVVARDPAGEGEGL
jgi:NADH-quinone oxidoreductase subunit J